MSSCDLLPLVVFMCNRNYQWKTNASLLGLRLVVLRFLDFSYDPYISILHPMLFGQHRVKFCTFEVSLPFDRCRPDNLVAQAQFWKFCPWIIFSFSGMPSVFEAFPKILGKFDRSWKALYYLQSLDVTNEPSLRVVYTFPLNGRSRSIWSNGYNHLSSMFYTTL